MLVYAVYAESKLSIILRRIVGFWDVMLKLWSLHE